MFLCWLLPIKWACWKDWLWTRKASLRSGIILFMEVNKFYILEGVLYNISEIKKHLQSNLVLCCFKRRALLFFFLFIFFPSQTLVTQSFSVLNCASNFRGASLWNTSVEPDLVRALTSHCDSPGNAHLTSLMFQKCTCYSAGVPAGVQSFILPIPVFVYKKGCDPSSSV